MTDQPVSVINDASTDVDVDVSVTVDLKAAQSREDIDWGDIRKLEIRVTEVDA